MANKEAWEDRRNFILLVNQLGNSLEEYKAFFEELEKFKVEVLSDSGRKAELQKLIDEDPDWTLTKIQNKYNEFKAIYDYLKQ